MSRSQRDKNVTREEKSREEKKHPPDPPAGGEGVPERRISLDHALILPPIVTHALQSYTPDLQQKAWSVLQDFLAYCPGNRSTGTLAKMAAAFADCLLARAEAEARLRAYLVVRDPVQIEREFIAGQRLRPGASPWEICEFLFPPDAARADKPPPGPSPDLERERRNRQAVEAMTPAEREEISRKLRQARRTA